MKIISWNCSGKFREKYSYIQKYAADIYVIQECEDPAQCDNPDYRRFAKNCIWVGDNKSRGLGIFATDGIALKKNNWKCGCLRLFLSVNVNGQFDLLGVWACKPYIAEYYIYQSFHIKKYNRHTIILGDFNSNAIWDKKHDHRSHSAVVRALADMRMVSAYHHVFHEQQGKERQYTFYLYRHMDKGYHIDHCFTNASNIKDYRVLFEAECLNLSDHIPICLHTNTLSK